MRPWLFWLRRHRALLVVTIAALAVRVVWNVWIHPPLRFSYSDMAGYIERANTLLDKPWVASVGGISLPPVRADYALFPYGTHVFLFAVKWLFGRDNGAAVGVAFACLGAGAVAFTYATAARLWAPKRLLPCLLGAFFVFYYPWISFGGYVLSETGFAFCLAGVAYFSLRLADRGQSSDAWLLGTFAAMGATFRPQMLVSLVFLGVHALVRRRAWRPTLRRSWPRILAPVALVLAFSAAHVHYHTGRSGLVSTNGPLNFAFGRCHATMIEAKTRGSKSWFGPPPFGALANYEKKHPNAVFKLDPAEGNVITFKGRMWDAESLYGIASRCVEKTGWIKQARYAVTHVVLLWGYNIPWPDQADKAFRPIMAAWSYPQIGLVVPALALALIAALKRRRGRELLLWTHVWALVVTAVLYFGDARFRTPYDGLIWTAVLGVYAGLPGTVLGWLVGRARAGRPSGKATSAPAGPGASLPA
jgi:hypothetical protein